MDTKLNAVAVRDYYHRLRKPEKSKFLKYLVSEIGLPYSTAVARLNGTYEIRKQDEILFNLAIANEKEWKA